MAVCPDFKYIVVGDSTGKIFFYMLTSVRYHLPQTPPLYMKSYQPSHSALNSICVDFDTKMIFAAGFDDEELDVSSYKNVTETVGFVQCRI